MPTLEELLARSAADHNHVCPRQVLGVRMGMLVAKLFDLPLPQTDKRLLAIVETDGCFADGVAAATGCTVGHRTMRVVDYGKIAVTFIDTKTGLAYRVRPRLDVRQRAEAYAQNERSRWHTMLNAYKVMPDEALLEVQAVQPKFDVGALMSRAGVRVNCDACGEEIINEREVNQNGRVLCRACAAGAYYSANADTLDEVLPVVILDNLPHFTNEQGE